MLHDAKGPMHALAARGLPLAGLACDTALAAYLALPGQRTFDLADLALRYLGKELREEADDGQLTLDGSRASATRRPGLVLRAQATLELAAALEADLDRRERRRAAARARAAAGRPCWPRWSGPGSPPTSSTSRPCPPACTAR